MKDITLSQLLENLTLIDILKRQIEEIKQQKREFIPARKYCEKYAVSRVTLWKWRKQGLVEHKRIGRKLYIKDVLPKEGSR